MTAQPKLYLASTSPRRREILQTLGIDFDVVPGATDESRMEGEAPSAMVLRLAIAKAEGAPASGFVLGADTVVVLDDRVLGKPGDANEAIDMLLALSGRTHTVYTGVALKTPERTLTALSATEVQFREIGRDEALAYWQSGEPRDKAGAYGIQGLGGAFVAAIHGSYSGVMGLPVFETIQLLKAVGIEILARQK
ncbi:MAG: Maf family nucleotide pyrophosphatase [Gammaproteobacteria bacterium]|nr:Maf family nucleotide pyrophosphatase [Gammaproteobacteria bacterium]